MSSGTGSALADHSRPAVMSKLSAYDNQIFNDGAIVGLVATTATHVAVGGSLLGGAAYGLLVAIPSFLGAGLISAFVADPPTPLRAAIVWAIFTGIGAEMIRNTTGSLTFAAVLGVLAFAFGTTRSIRVIRRGPALPAATPSPALPGAPAPPVPKDLPEALQAIVDAADADFTHLRDALDDPALARSAGVDAAGIRGEALRLLHDILRRAPLAAHLHRLADERPDDPGARKARDEALAALRGQGDALRAAATAALQVAVTDARDPALLRDQTENLQLLHDAQRDADPRS